MMAKQTKMLLALAVAVFVASSHARPYPDETPAGVSNDPLARYEVYVPDGTGNMAQQLLTLTEIRSLLARQSDADDFDDAQMKAQEHVSLAGGKGTVETIPSGEKSPRVDVSDVVSSVKTIMASRMAELDQEAKPVYVDAQELPADPVGKDEEATTTAADSLDDVTEAADVAADTASEDAVQPVAPELAEATKAQVTEETVQSRDDLDRDHHEHHDHHEQHHHEHHGEHHGEHHHEHHHEHQHPAAVFEPVPKGNQGLLATNQDQDPELHELTKSSNKLAWQVWSNAIKQRSVENNEVMSPLAMTSALGIAFLGARGSTAEAIDAALELDKLTSRNPHLHLQQVARDVDVGQHFQSAQSHTVYVDEAKSQVQDIFRARVDTLYGASFTSNISEVKNMVRSDMAVQSPFTIVSSASLNVAWPSNTVPVGEEEEYLHFLNLPSSAQVVSGRRLVAVPTIRTSGHFFAGYDAELDATAVAVPLHPVREGEETNWAPSDALNQAGHLSLVMIMPGSNGAFEAGGSGLAGLESRLANRPDAWDHLLKSTKPYNLQVEMPKLGGESHLSLARSLQSPAIGNLSVVFDPRRADFRGISSARPLYMSDLIQMSKLNISSVAAIVDEDDIHARKNDKVRQGAPAKQVNKPVNKPKPTKVQTTVKTPCQDAVDEAVDKALAAAMEAIRKVSKTQSASPAAKKPAPQTNKTPAKPQNKVQPKPGQPKPAQGKPVQGKPVQGKPTPAKQGAKPASNNKVQPAPAKPVQKKPAQSKPVQKKPAQTQPAQAKPVQKKPVHTQPAQAKPIQKKPAQVQPAQGKPAQKKPTQAQPQKKVPVKTPAAARPATQNQQKKPVNKAPVKQTSVNKTPAKQTPVNKAPAKQTPVKPVNKAPVKQAPAKTSVKPAPAKTPAKPAPINKAPVKETSAKPAHKAPVKQTPVKQAPLKQQIPNKPPIKQNPANKPAVKPSGGAKPTAKKPVTTTKKPVQQATALSAGAAGKTTVRPRTTTRPTVKNVAKTTPKVQTKTPAKPAQKPTNAKTTPANNKKPVTNNQPQVKKPRVEREVGDAIQHITFNRAFLYAVRHNPTGLLMMIGRYVHPDQE